MDLRQSKNYAAYLKQTGWVIEKIDETFVYIRKLPLTPFSVIKIQRPERIPDLKIIDRLAKKYRALYIFLEPSFRPHSPLSNLKTHNYKLAKSPYLPTKTIHLDLTQSEKKLLAQMKKDARHYLKKPVSYTHLTLPTN